MTVVMDDATAEWVRSVVLPPKVLKSWGGDKDGVNILHLCSCQYGMCGWCGQLDRHDKCTTWHGFNGNPNPSPLAYIQARAGGCLTPVWPKHGKPCRWICPCPVCLARQAVPTQPPVFAQDSLFTVTPEVRRAPRTPDRRPVPPRRKPVQPDSDLLGLLDLGA